jgi:hypothetical protein
MNRQMGEKLTLQPRVAQTSENVSMDLEFVAAAVIRSLPRSNRISENSMLWLALPCLLYHYRLQPVMKS